AAPARSEKVYFTITVPRKEISVRADGQPAPTVILGHGYTGNRFNGLEISGFFAKYGMATITIDNVSHGLGVSPEEEVLATFLLEEVGLKPYAEATFTDRASDQNGDGIVDSGADFWTSYLFHTRDVVRQTALDYMQLVRVMRAWDGQERWDFDLDGDGQNELAGDFDGDGTVDLGGDAPLYMSGGSLGGMMTMIMGGLEPEIDVIVPIVGGGGLGDLGVRSLQSGVREAFILRPFGPLYTGTLDEEAGGLVLETIIPDLTDVATIALATVPDVEVGDTLWALNTSNGERACGYVNADGEVRVHLESDVGDGLELSVYEGNALVLGSEDCELSEDATVRAVVDTFEETARFQTETFGAGEPLVSLSEGLGLRRANPELRRFQGLGQLILDLADPAVYLQGLWRRPITYEGTGQTTGAHMLQLTGIGDMSVPVGGAMTAARAAGVLDYLEAHPDYGVPENQVLIDHFVAEGVTITSRYTDDEGTSVLFDIDNFSEGDDLWGADIPRADVPLRVGVGETDPLGGVSASLFMYSKPEGQHGPNLPGWCFDEAQEDCEAACAEGEDCGCDEVTPFDDGLFYFNMIGMYLASEGAEIETDRCMSSDDCEGMPLPPAPRANPDLSEELVVDTGDTGEPGETGDTGYQGSSSRGSDRGWRPMGDTSDTGDTAGGDTSDTAGSGA
ncbi:MAG: hypothetical protein QGG40_12000, partial [Myxococcota bacterium]|nr:hypothetical protein [Myxococcota bacterium]